MDWKRQYNLHSDVIEQPCKVREKFMIGGTFCLLQIGICWLQLGCLPSTLGILGSDKQQHKFKGEIWCFISVGQLPEGTESAALFVCCCLVHL